MQRRKPGHEQQGGMGGSSYYGQQATQAPSHYSYGNGAKTPNYSGYGSSSSSIGIGAGNADGASPYTSSNSSSRMTMGGVGKGRRGGGGGGGFSFKMDKFMISLLFGILMAIVALYYRSNYNSNVTKFHTKSVVEAVNNYEKLESEKKRYENEARNNRNQQTTLKTSIRELEKQNREKENQIRDLKQKMTDASINKKDQDKFNRQKQEETESQVQEISAENDYLTKREVAWRDQVWLLQNATQREAWRTVVERFGVGPHHVKFTLQFYEPDEEASFTVELAPLQKLPHANHFFLEQVYHELWDGTWFYLNGPHVLQAGPQDWEEEEAGMSLARFKQARLDQLSFPEYHPDFPHKPWTLGFTGRPGGPEFYINKADNSKPHGPGGQWQHGLEEQADSCFAKVVEGQDVLQRVFRAESYDREGDYPYFLYEPVEILRARIQEKIEDKINKPEKIKMDKNKRKNKPQRKIVNQELLDKEREEKERKYA